MPADSDRRAPELFDAKVDGVRVLRGRMPSLPAISIAEAVTGKPVLTAAVTTTRQMLKALDLDTPVPGGGTFLSGAH